MTKFKYAILSVFVFPVAALAVNVPISIFPMSHYSQNINRWLNPENPNYNKRLLSAAYQRQRLKIFYDHWYETKGLNSTSPWNKNYFYQEIHQQPNLKTLESDLVIKFSNEGKSSDRIGYGENFRPHTKQWIENIRANMNINRLAGLAYDANHRAIAITNLNVRLLPTDDPHFYSFTQAGEGYPFDNLQESSLWVGTPVYIIARSKDKAWDLVLTPDFIAWVHSDGIAKVSEPFVSTWTQTAKSKTAAAIHTKTAVVDAKGNFQFYAYVGSVFPLTAVQNKQLAMLIPERGENGFAKIKAVRVSRRHWAPMPLPATPHQFSIIFSSLLGRPYGWGGIHFYNDCSQELKSLFAPFGIWLPRHSADQVSAGKMVDKSGSSINQRLQYLINNGHPLMTIVYIGDHVVLYVGADKGVVMTYQDVWGLHPADGDRRAVIGGTVFLPMLKQYPEDRGLSSLAGRQYFQVAFLDQWPVMLNASPRVSLKALVLP